MFDTPFVVGALVEIGCKILVEFAGIGPKRLIFVAISHNSPPVEKLIIPIGSSVDSEAVL